jgi:hypothetical protein
MPDFIPGLSLGGLFYRETVKPILDKQFPGLAHSAALIGAGSEILGFDTEMSTDHDWGPRVMLFLGEEDHARHSAAIQAALGQGLPREYRGYRTDFKWPEPEDAQADGSGLVRHSVQTLTPRGYVRSYLGFDLGCDLEPADWLTFPEQKLRAITTGAVYHDGIGLQAVRDRFDYYPHDVWLYLLAAGWTRIGQEEHLMGRAGLVGDEIGSALLGSRLVRDVMRLCFLMEKQYAPYPKWFGTAFRQLACAAALSPLLEAARRAASWPEREEYLCRAYEYLAATHNALGITELLPARVSGFHNRPFRVIPGGRFAEALRQRIQDPVVSRIARQRLIGSIDQWSDSTDILEGPWRGRLRRLFEHGAERLAGDRWNISGVEEDE